MIVVAAFPLLLQVTRHLQAQNLNVAGSGSQWADQQLGQLRTVPSAGPVLITGIGGSALQTEAATAGLSAGWLHAMPAGDGTLFLPAAGASRSAVNPFLQTVRQQGGTVTDVSGSAVSHEIIHDTETTLHSSAAIALPLLIILLPIVFGAVTQSLVPLVVAALGSELALAVVSILERYMTLSVYLTDITTFLALGVGVDYALFITTRFAEALDRGVPVPEAVGEAMRTSGRSVLFSGMAVTLAVSTLFIAGTSYWRGLALGGAAAVVAVLLTTHTLLPALLRLVGRHLRWGLVPVAMERWPLFPSLARWSTWRPWVSVGIGVGLLLLPALAAGSLRSTMPANLAVMLPRSSPQRQATQLQQQIAGAGSIAPLPVVLQLPTTVGDASTWQTVATVTVAIGRLPDVARIVSPTSTGLAPQVLAQAAAAKDPTLSAFIAPAANPHMVALEVIARSGPDAQATSQLLNHINTILAQDLPRGSRGAVGGAVGVLHDFTQHTNRRLPWVIGGAALVALVVLLVATGSLTQALLGVVMDGLVALATAGILVLTVQQGRFGLDALPPNLTVTPLIFVLLFGLSMDYEVILLHRVQEALRRGVDVREAAREGIAQTGGMITGAGLVMVAVFVVLLISPLEILQTLAIGMTAAILLDTWIVRTFLIPGITVLLGSKAFWPWGLRHPVAMTDNPRQAG